MPVGDVNSSERGSGARYNDGKPDLSLIPLHIIANSYVHTVIGEQQENVLDALRHLGRFQTTGSVTWLEYAIRDLSDYWTDCARVFEYGKKKYAAWNWAKGMAWSIPLACAGRHALAILEDEEFDGESQQRHVGHLLCNVVMLRHFVQNFPEGNDLPPRDLFHPTSPEEGTSE